MLKKIKEFFKKTFKKDKSEIELMIELEHLNLFNDMVKEFYKLEKEVHKLVNSNQKNKKVKFRSIESFMFNQIEYMCFIGNRDERVGKFIHDFFSNSFKMLMHKWLKEDNPKAYHNDKRFEEWKKFMKKIK